MQSISSRFKRILVTGSGGVLGTAVRQVVSSIDDVYAAFPSRSECNLLDSADVDEYVSDFKPDLILHLAGKVFGVQGNIDFCGQIFYENTVINLNVIEAARKFGVQKVVAAGTAAIYSDLVKMPMREEELWLGEPHGSEGPYGHAKRGMLAQLEAYKKQYGLDYAYLILTNLYGPNDRFDEKFGHVVPSLVSRFVKAKLNNAEEVVVWGDGSPTRDFLFSEDAATAFLVAAEKGHGPMNIATGRAIPIKELVETIVRSVGYEGRVVWDVGKPLGQLVRSYDVEKIKALGWMPKWELQSGIDNTVAWFKENLEAVRT